jgi:hypothetical protein
MAQASALRQAVEIAAQPVNPALKQQRGPKAALRFAGR